VLADSSRPRAPTYLGPDASAAVRAFIAANPVATPLLRVESGMLRGTFAVSSARFAEDDVVDVQLLPPVGKQHVDFTVPARVIRDESGTQVEVSVPVPGVPDGALAASVRIVAAWHPPDDLADRSLLDLVSATLEPFPTDPDEWSGIVVTTEGLLSRTRRWVRALVGLEAITVVDDGLAAGLGVGADDSAGVIELELDAPVHLELRNHREPLRVVGWDFGERGTDVTARKIFDEVVAAGARKSWTIRAAPSPGEHLVVIACGNDDELADALELITAKLEEAELFAVLEELESSDARAWRYRTR